MSSTEERVQAIIRWGGEREQAVFEQTVAGGIKWKTNFQKR